MFFFCFFLILSLYWLPNTVSVPDPLPFLQERQEAGMLIYPPTTVEGLDTSGAHVKSFSCSLKEREIDLHTSCSPKS